MYQPDCGTFSKTAAGTDADLGGVHNRGVQNWEKRGGGGAAKGEMFLEHFLKSVE